MEPNNFPYHMLDNIQYMEKRMEEDRLHIKDYKQMEIEDEKESNYD